MIFSVITGTGCYIPDIIVHNSEFLDKVFFDSKGEKIDKANDEIIEKFKSITTIEKRRYAPNDINASDMGYNAAIEAIKSSGVDKETLDYIIVAHNFGDNKHGMGIPDCVPGIASKIKRKLQIINPETVAYDIVFGCPGWLQAVIQADYYIKSGDAKRILVIGTEVLSRMSDPYDRDSMIYADGAGAVVLEAKESDTPIGIIAHKTRTDSLDYSNLLYMGHTYNPDCIDNKRLFIKMNGHKLYQYALDKVPLAIKSCIEKAGFHINDISKVLIHQANGKMDDAILKRLYSSYGIKQIPKDIMPMSISYLGNSSVATLPTLLDLIIKGNMEGQKLMEGDLIVFASVGAGMNINALVYKM
jgi:3-oxoacyl-[acyl-carrier-protein] synthase-3